MKDPHLHGPERVISINKALGSDHYINPIGGLELYSRTEFSSAGIALSFLRGDTIGYPQGGSGEFVPNLSIIDVLMNNSLDSVRAFLRQYELV